MNIRTTDGIRIHCLPDNAKCARSGRSPEDMDKCPTYNFDDFGEYCVPELCEYYTEDSKKEEKHERSAN